MDKRIVNHLLSIRTDQCKNQTSCEIFSKIISKLFDIFDICKIFQSEMETETLVLCKSLPNTTYPTLLITCRCYQNSHIISINFESSIVNEKYEAVKSLSTLVDSFRNQLSDMLGFQIERIPALNRGFPYNTYYITSDDRVIQYDFDNVLFQKRSNYQMVSILHSKTFNNVLLLDDMQNLSERDIAYTHGIMNYGKIDYTNKEILILGGGDGGLLNEIIKENPSFVTMVDIDKVVIDSCRQFLRGACGSVLDTMKTDKYEIIIDDCIKYLQDSAEKQKKFDIIINDLTDIPIVENKINETGKNPWTLVEKILNFSLECLNKNGKYLNYTCGISCDAWKTYEDLLQKLSYKVDFTRHSAFVPSFLEEWVFYEITKTTSEGN